MNDGNDLFKNNQKLVYYTLNKYYPRYVNDDDVKQIAFIALWRASENYKDNGTAFSTYAAKAIKQSVSQYLQKESKNKHLHYESKNTDNDDLCFSSALAVCDKELETAEFKADYERFCTTLTQQQRLVVEFLLEGYFYVEIAKKLGIDHRLIGEIVKSIGKKWNNFKGGVK